MAKEQRLRTLVLSLSQIIKVNLMSLTASRSLFLSEQMLDHHMRDIFRQTIPRITQQIFTKNLKEQASSSKGTMPAFQQQQIFAKIIKASRMTHI